MQNKLRATTISLYFSTNMPQSLVNTGINTLKNIFLPYDRQNQPQKCGLATLSGGNWCLVNGD